MIWQTLSFLFFSFADWPRSRFSNLRVSHHIHCNDEEVDEDVFSPYPLLRFDHRLPKKWFHRFQHIYMWG